MSKTKQQVMAENKFSPKEADMYVLANARAAAKAALDAAPAVKAETKAAAQAHIAANRAKRQLEETTAAAHNAAATIPAKHKPAPNTKPAPKGSGALIGVAVGATDGQPHTKLAVEQARKQAQAARAQTAPETAYQRLKPLQGTAIKALAHKAPGRAKAKDIAGNTVWVPESHTTWIVKGVFYNNASRVGDAMLRAANPTTPQAQSAAPKAAAPQPKAPAAARPYAKGPTAYAGKPDTWTAYMIATAIKHKDTQAATQAHKASGRDDAGKPLDFKWMDAKGYIKFA